MAQIALPDGNSSTSNWLEVAGDGDGNWFDELDEGVSGTDHLFVFGSSRIPVAVALPGR